MTFKSGIFDRRDMGNPTHKDMQQTKNHFLNPLSGSYFYPFTTQPVTKTGTSSIDSENIKTSSRPMFSSSMFGMESKSSGGSLFQMAKTVEERNDTSNIEAEKEKNKYSFLQMPKLNTINSA